jgi:glycosyltransferase involved in cell wall biosynthesis
VFQYLDYFKQDYCCEVFPLFTDDYIYNLYGGKKKSLLQICKCYLKRIWQILTEIKKNDILFIEYELLPYLPAVFEKHLNLLGIKYIVDYDDAIFHNYDNKFVKLFLRNKIRKVIAYSQQVITGSPYLTKFAQKYGLNVIEIPTSIDTEKYDLKYNDKKDETNFTVGWIGTPSTSGNLLLIKNALLFFIEKHPEVNVKFIGMSEAIAESLGFPSIAWDAQTEIDVISSFDVGIMPLENNSFNRGKCGFKLIQYMACAKPTISTPLEANIKINRNKKNLHANGEKEWVEALENIYDNRNYFVGVGNENRKIVEKYYSIAENSVKYKLIFQRLFQTK